MAARGGRGGRGRGGGGGGPGRNDNMPSTGAFSFTDIMAFGKEGADILYPDMQKQPETEGPDEREAKIAKRYNDMTAEMKFTSCWLTAPSKASSDIERWSDRYKNERASADGQPVLSLVDFHARRQFDKDLLPPAIFEAVFEKKKKRARVGGNGKVKRAKLKSIKDLGEGEDGGDDDDDDDDEEDADDLDDEEDDGEDDNDYGDNYFDNGSDDGGDALGGTGAGDEGGAFD